MISFLLHLVARLRRTVVTSWWGKYTNETGKQAYMNQVTQEGNQKEEDLKQAKVFDIDSETSNLSWVSLDRYKISSLNAMTKFFRNNGQKFWAPFLFTFLHLCCTKDQLLSPIHVLYWI